MPKELEMMTSQQNAQWNFETNYTKLPEKFYSLMEPNPVKSPELILFNEGLAEQLGLNVSVLKNEGVDVFAGNAVPPNARPLAQAYAGHQFGHFTKLGDGRAMLYGEHKTPQGERFDIQLKGSGRTPYSRGGDGRAALGPMLREYIVSEAMYHLNIPTTRALAVVATGEEVIRETILEGAILTRLAKSHLRVGTFQYAYHYGTKDDIRALVDYAIDSTAPELKHAANKPLALLELVIERQASLIANWQLVGFVHGVMNTDNMTISGETIDYGPCAFIDTYHPKTVFSSIDRGGRYAYINQPPIAEWNLARFAETFLPLIHEDEEEAVKIATDTLYQFRSLYAENWLAGMRKKLGLLGEEESDQQLIDELLTLMDEHGADYTNTFLSLTFQRLKGEVLFETDAFKCWYKRWKDRAELEKHSAEVMARMKQHNPAMIPRNFYVEEAIEAAIKGHDYTLVHELVRASAEPYAHSELQKKYERPPSPNNFYRTFCGT